MMGHRTSPSPHTVVCHWHGGDFEGMAQSTERHVAQQVDGTGNICVGRWDAGVGIRQWKLHSPQACETECGFGNLRQTMAYGQGHPVPEVRATAYHCPPYLPPPAPLCCTCLTIVHGQMEENCSAVFFFFLGISLVLVILFVQCTTHALQASPSRSS